MHEYGLFKLLLPQLKPYIDLGKKLKRIRLRIGELKGIQEDHLVHAFEHLKDEYPVLSNCELSWEISKIGFTCRKCKTKFKLPQTACPTCGETNPDITSGNEFELIDVEPEEVRDV